MPHLPRKSAGGGALCVEGREQALFWKSFRRFELPVNEMAVCKLAGIALRFSAAGAVLR
jgi:hypothetical protein